MASIAPNCHTRNKYSSDSWITPRWLIDQIGPFDLDPCASIPQPWACAKNQYTEKEDGLLQPWNGFVYLNPPYGRAMGAWLNKLALYGNGIALAFARTETQAFFNNVWPFADRLLFLDGRLTFRYPDGSIPLVGNSGGPSVLIAYGKTAAKRLLDNSRLGALVEIVR